MKGPTRPVHGVVARCRVEATWALLCMWQLSAVNDIARISQGLCSVVQLKSLETGSSEVTNDTAKCIFYDTTFFLVTFL